MADDKPLFDSRITPARPDLAAAHLKGQVKAKRFVKGRRQRVARGRTGLHVRAETAAPRESELLCGEIFTVYEDKAGWSWGQAESDSYVGYVHSACLEAEQAPDARVIALATPMLPAPDVKSVLQDLLPLNAQVKIAARKDGFAELAGGGFVYERHLAPLDARAGDFAAVAQSFAGMPYVWGGKTLQGLDCSGLIQTALAACGFKAPRDTDMQESALGKLVSTGQLQRGDLVFWKGHMGVMLDGARLLHANVFHMQVAIENLKDAVARIEKTAGPVTSIKRL